jgi:plastocyanin
VILLSSAIPVSNAAPAPELHLVIKDQAFKPTTLTISAGQTVKIVIKNEDALPAEFESSDINREKVIPGGTEIPIFIGPLTAGTFHFINDFHPESKGTLIVKPAKQ